MNLYLRLLTLWLRRRARPAVSPLAPSRLRLRVWPNDLDLFGHMNNGRYLTVMDLGRLDIVLGSGLLKVMRRRRWYAVAATVEIQFLRPLKLWRRYCLTTEILDWDEFWFVFEQRFDVADKPAARALVRAQFRHERDPVATAEVFAAAGWNNPRPPGGGKLVESLRVATELTASASMPGSAAGR
ncbi:MAG TPA: acyl-CoA thioesterase [Gammaproteobacteria bacterium]|nr:acyl-CoA thioesterase [Gammaproteobacteria bacterium]